MPQAREPWPSLPLAEWETTYRTLHLWSQIVGKIRMSQMPWINHSWHVALYVSARGLTTSLIPYEQGGVEIEFDFLTHQLHIQTADGRQRTFPLAPMSVAAFYAQVMETLNELRIQVEILARPVEIPDPVHPFPEDEVHASYDPEAAQRCWQILVQAHRVFTAFRARFSGKVSPVHFFWGAFDLAVTRFSGRTAPKHPGGIPNCADWVMEEAYSHEVSSAGFWPGGGAHLYPYFYSYAYPEPDGYATATVTPEGAFYSDAFGQFVLPYDRVRESPNPDNALLAFLQSTYEAAADLGDWDRAALEVAWAPHA